MMATAVGVAILQLVLVSLWIPQIDVHVSSLLAEVALHPKWLPLPLATTAMAYCMDMRSRVSDPPFALKWVHGAALGLHGSYLVLVIASATGIDLGRVDASVFDDIDSVPIYRIMFSIFMPAAMGPMLDKPFARWAKRARRTADTISSMLGRVLVTSLGLAFGSAMLAALSSDRIRSSVSSFLN